MCKTNTQHRTCQSGWAGFVLVLCIQRNTWCINRASFHCIVRALRNWTVFFSILCYVDNFCIVILSCVSSKSNMIYRPERRHTLSLCSCFTFTILHVFMIVNYVTCNLIVLVLGPCSNCWSSSLDCQLFIVFLPNRSAKDGEWTKASRSHEQGGG